MEIKINLDLENILAAAVSTEKVQPLIDKAIGEALKDAIRDATDYRSPFRTALKEQLTQAIPHGLAIDECVKFQFLFNQAVNAAVQGANAETIQTALKEALEYALPTVPTQIKLSDLMEAARDSFHKESHEAFYAKLIPFEVSGGGRLFLDRDEYCRDHYSASICLAFTEQGQVYTLKLDGKQVLPTVLPKVITRFESLLLAMYVGRTTLEVDIDEYDVESAARSKEDY